MRSFHSNKFYSSLLFQINIFVAFLYFSFDLIFFFINLPCSTYNFIKKQTVNFSYFLLNGLEVALLDKSLRWSEKGLRNLQTTPQIFDLSFFIWLFKLHNFLQFILGIFILRLLKNGSIIKNNWSNDWSRAYFCGLLISNSLGNLKFELLIVLLIHFG